MSELITTGVWRVTAGHEAEFVAAWTEFAEHASTLPGASTLRLGRDRGDASRFVSFAPWTDADAAHGWKAQPDFKERIGRVLQHVDSFEPSELDTVATVAAAPSGEATP